MLRGRELRDDALLPGLDVDGATITCLLRVLGGKPRTHRIPLRWWFGFSRSYEDGRAGEGRIRHVLSGVELGDVVELDDEIEFGDGNTASWCPDAPLSDWEGLTLHSGILLLDRLDIFSW